MRRIAIFAAIVWGLAALEGCGGSDTPTDAQAQAQPNAPPLPPEVVTREFLEAVRTGDHVKADALLTDMAREKTKQVDLQMAPTATPTAKYEVGEVEIMEGQVAHVESFWTDIGEDGKPKTIPFVWALRLDKDGWRIGGVATKLFDDAPLLLLNFEDPEDMLHKQAMLEAEMTRRMNGGAPGATANGPLAAGANGTTAPGAATAGGQSVAGQPSGGVPSAFAPGAVPPGIASPGMAAPGALPPGAAMPVGASQPFNPAAPGSLTPPTAMAPGALPPGTPTSNGLPPGTIVPAGGFSAPSSPSSVQSTGAQALPAPGFLPPGAQAQQPLPPGTAPR
jgi:hypothetical protein